MKRAVAFAALIACASCTASPGELAAQREQSDRAFAEAIDGRVPGKTETCITTNLSQGPTIINGNTISYPGNGGSLWVSRIEACPSLRPLTTLIIEKYGSQLCRNDQFRVLEPGVSIPSAKCRFGNFTQFDRPS